MRPTANTPGPASRRAAGGAVRSPFPPTKDTVIPPADPDHPLHDDPPEQPLDPAAEPVAGGDAGDVDEDELDARWGFAPEQPLVGFGAPPVVAVVVASDPGDWFEATLESLADQDYESLEVLVIVNDGEEDPTGRIAEVLPSAYVKRLEVDRGFSAAANEVLTTVEGAAFHLILHDDVRLEPGTVTALVSEAFRANAGVVGPKLVGWADRSLLMSVGYSVDAFGAASSIAEPGELDQSQHDSAREVFAVSDACMLVRSDLFASIGGFSEDIPFFGQDIDLCWRAHVAGASVQLCPEAVVAHRGRFGERRVVEDAERLELRHQARSMLANYEPFRLLRVLPVAALFSAVDLIASLLFGHFRRAGDVAASWVWNVLNLPSLLRARSRVKRVRRAHDAEYVPIMRRGSSRLLSLFRAEEGENRLAAVADAGRGYLKQLTTGSNRVGTYLGVVAAVLVVVGTRDLITGEIPVLRELVDAGRSPGRLLSEWWSGWREVGLGEPGVAPGIVAGLGVVGGLLLGSVELARRLLVLLPLFVGALGAWKLLVATGSSRARAAALVVYGLNPVVLNAFAEGRLSAMVVYGAAPWVLRRAARAAAVEPFVAPGAGPAPRLRSSAGTALVLAVVAAVSPLGAAVLVLGVAMSALGPAVTGQRQGSVRMVLHVLGAALMSLPTCAPWLVQSLLRGDSASLTGLWSGNGASPSAAELITGDLGPVEVGVFGWGVVVAAAYALAAGRSWRLGWGVAGWATAFASWIAATTLVDAGALAGAGPELVLVPAVLGLSVSVGMGALSFEHDVVGSDFGLTQLLSGVAVLALLVGLVPVAIASADGRWYLPEGDFGRLLQIVDEGEDFRTAWIGDPDVLPVAGWELDAVDGVAVGVSVGLDPTVTQRYRLDGGAGVEVLRGAVDAALTGQTSRLGRLLAPTGVRYVVVVDRPAPSPFAAREVPLPEGTLASMDEQLDLARIEINPGIALFEVQDPWPLRSDLAELEVPGGDVSLAEQVQGQLPAPERALPARHGVGTRISGRIGSARVGHSSTADPGWTLTVDGDVAERSAMVGWAQQFRAGSAGDAELAWSPPFTTRALQLVQVAGLIALVVLAGRRRRLVPVASRRRAAAAPAEDGPLIVVGPHEDETGPDGTEIVDTQEPPVGEERS